ncbi:GrpB family protein [Pseudonocardia acaciae]|uniref:GrpB family protein n=1 Tax=Pseudonocardia acaciae TaxID=551276 RepID=UPI00048C7FDC|nr:GrpB family protein [Pseudonocardia acaciae]
MFELIGGREKREIRIVEYDPGWPGRFGRERERIATALGPVARRIDHIGSTSVPGLMAKPIVDIQVSVPDVEDEPSYLPGLLAVGYRHRVREPGHRMVRTPERDVHVHVCDAGGEWEWRHLLLRDWLRREPADRDAYQRLKRELARRDWADMNDYADAKGPLIAEMTDRAEAWARSSGWTPGGA